jgi:hypothetical protein
VAVVLLETISQTARMKSPADWSRGRTIQYVSDHASYALLNGDAFARHFSIRATMSGITALFIAGTFFPHTVCRAGQERGVERRMWGFTKNVGEVANNKAAANLPGPHVPRFSGVTGVYEQARRKGLRDVRLASKPDFRFHP